VKAEIEGGLGRLEDAGRSVGNGPARYFRLSGAPGTIGFISAVSDHFCHRCNRLRLTAEGMIRPCLYSGREVDARTPLRLGAGAEELADLFRQAVLKKPDRHSIDSGWNDNRRIMSQIGG
jgi:cyclic pyranopterin phosphate synthase